MKNVRDNEKLIMLLLNFLCTVVGLVLLIMGAIGLSRFKHTSKLLTNSMGFFPCFILVLGIVVFLSSFLGYYTLYHMRRRWLLIYAVILLVVFSIHLCSSMYGLVKMINFKNTTSTKMEREWFNITLFYGDYPNDLKYHVDGLQQRLRCCGVTGPMNYPYSIPLSCCNDFHECGPFESFQTGCLKSTLNFLDKTLKIIIYVGLPLCVIELLAGLLILYIGITFKTKTNAPRKK